MLLVTALASLVVLATGVVADPSKHHHSHPHSLSISKHINTKGKYHPVQKDRSRLKHLVNKANRVNSSSAVEETAGSLLTTDGPFYEAKIGVGVPPTYCKSCDDFLSSI